MNNEIFQIWQEVQADLSTPAVLWQLAIVIAAVVIAHAINGMLRKYVMEHAPLHWKIAIGSINRVLFPLSSLILILVGQLILGHWQHIGLLKLANRLFLAMAAIRLIVYFMRYLFTGAWLKTVENVAAWTIWGLLALHLTGLLPQIMQSLADVQFSIGKNPVNLLLIIQGLFTIVITIFVALWISRLFENKLMRTEQMNVNMRVVLTKLIRILLLFVAILIALSAVGLDITLLSVFGGALGVGLGFGLQKIASNYVSGFIILLDKSMQIGDVIAVDKHYGVVHDLRSRYMVLSKLDGTNVIIPNETLITTAVVNHSLMEHKGRVQIIFTISYDSPLELAMQLLRDVVIKQDRVIKVPAPDALVRGFGEFGIELVLTAWVIDPEKGISALQSAVYLELWRAFSQNGIRFVKPADIRVE